MCSDSGCPIKSRGAAGKRTRIEVPLFEGGAGLDFFFLTAQEFEKQRPDVRVDLYGIRVLLIKCAYAFLKEPFQKLAMPG